MVADLRQSRERLSHLIVRFARDPFPGSSQLLDDARRQNESAEEALAAKSVEFRRRLARQAIGLKEVLAQVGEGSALVAFVAFDREDLSPPPNPVAWHNKAVPYYGVFVIGSRHSDPVWLALGKAAEIDSLVAAWRATLEPLRIGGPLGVAACRSAGQALRARIWGPLSPHLEGAVRIFLVPDGTLNQIAFYALPAPGERYLVESDLIVHLLSTERDLIPEHIEPPKDQAFWPSAELTSTIGSRALA